MPLVARFHRLNENAKLPHKGSKYAAGLDLHADLSGLPLGDRSIIHVRPNRVILVPTGLICVEFPQSTYGRVAPRSGLAVKQGVHVMAGVIDRDYRGEIMVALTGVMMGDVAINHGDRIAQLIFECYQDVEVSEEAYNTDAHGSERGAGGFGSTGR